MTQENKSRLIKFLWNLASAVLAAIGAAFGVSCAVAQIGAEAQPSPERDNITQGVSLNFKIIYNYLFLNVIEILYLCR